MNERPNWTEMKRLARRKTTSPLHYRQAHRRARFYGVAYSSSSSSSSSFRRQAEGQVNPSNRLVQMGASQNERIERSPSSMA